jgi:hypothetical protein
MIRMACGLVMVGWLLLLNGCAPAAGARAPRASSPAATSQRAVAAPNLNTDPCATRLHDLCGSLLMYYREQQKLPPALADLSQTAGFAAIGELACPESHQAYVYVPEGFSVPGVPGTVVVYDPLPSHAGWRWAITIIPGQGPLVAKVIALPKTWNP